MVHGDDQGLILPPRLAPHQVVIVPIFKTDEEGGCLRAAKKIREQLVKAEIRVKVDEREGQSPVSSLTTGKCAASLAYGDRARRTSPKASVVLARRDRPGKEGKSFVSRTVLPGRAAMLIEIQKALFDRALAFRGRTHSRPKNFDEFRQAVEVGFAQSYWCGDSKCEEQIKEATKATLRCIPIEQPSGTGSCISAANLEGDCYLW